MRIPGRLLDDEPGVPLERTAMAWQRTGLAAVAVGVLVLHTGPGAGASGWLGLAVLLAGMLLTAAMAPLRYSRGSRAITFGDDPARPGWVLAAALTVAALAGAVAVGVLVVGIA